MGFVFFFIALVAGNVVMWRTFLQRGERGLFEASVRSATLGFLTTLAVLLLCFGLASAFGLSR